MKARMMAGMGVLGGLCFVAACGDPVPPAAQASVSIHVNAYDDPINHPMDRCPPDRHWVNIPYQRGREPREQTQGPNQTDHGAVAVNNQDGNVISCRVVPSGSKFLVTASAQGYAENAVKKISPATVNISIPSIGPDDSSAPGRLALSDAASINTYESTDCTYSVSGGELGIGAGQIWAKVHCENLGFERSPGSNCLVDDGYFIFENCADK
ncbi:MAG TPA: hypothetical protein VK550_29450 [Polyangiaceae bacterium]|nr:hypothetical protein [Polyangiaceae bacterium]